MPKYNITIDLEEDEKHTETSNICKYMFRYILFSCDPLIISECIDKILNLPSLAKYIDYNCEKNDEYGPIFEVINNEFEEIINNRPEEIQQEALTDELKWQILKHFLLCIRNNADNYERFKSHVFDECSIKYRVLDIKKVDSDVKI